MHKYPEILTIKGPHSELSWDYLTVLGTALLQVRGSYFKWHSTPVVASRVTQQDKLKYKIRGGNDLQCPETKSWETKGDTCICLFLDHQGLCKDFKPN